MDAHDKTRDGGDPFDEGMFSHIALSLSGGGVRAVGFHLGTLDVLERMDLLRNVHILSTVSGGSLVGTSYALAAQEDPGQAFQKCFYSLFDFLPGLNTLEQILAGVTGPMPPAPSGRRDLVTGMANVFQEQFYERHFESARFGAFWEGESHLKEIIFNATEFRTGNAFRFQKSEFPCHIGNGNVWITEDHARQMRMGDVMAASCCIPVGMEPFFFPNDFHWPDDDQSGRPTCTAVGNFLRNECRGERGSGEQKPFVPLMDGGVYDNQGLSSVLLAMLRRNKARERDEHLDIREPSGGRQWGDWMQKLLRAKNNTSDGEADAGVDLSHLRLFIVSDTPLRSEPFYPAGNGDIPEPIPGATARMTIGNVDTVMFVISLLLLWSVGDNLYEIFRRDSTYGLSGIENVRQIIGVVIPTVTCGLILAGIVNLRRSVKKLEHTVEGSLPAFKRSLWHYVKKIRIADALLMVSLRLGSLSALTTKVYLNRIRQLGYGLLFSSGTDERSLGRRVMTNEIYTLIDPDCISDALPPITPGGHIARIAEIAATMKTAVWVDPSVTYQGRREMDILVAAGQMTCCYNLMYHIHDRFSDSATGELPAGSVAERYYRQLLAIWRRFEHDPFSLVDERKREVGIPVV